MEDIIWSNEMGHRSRKAWLLFILDDGKIVSFSGETIPGIVVVIDDHYHKNGRWSHTKYRLRVSSKVVSIISGYDGWDTGRFDEGLRKSLKREEPIDSWEELSAALGIDIKVAKEFLRQWRPKAAERFDKIESDLASIA